MSIFVSSTKQIASGRVMFAAAASFSALLFAARPTISIRSGMSCATFSVLSPIDPVAPKTTTRLRFMIVLDSLNPNYQPEIKKQKRRGEKQTVDQIERSADSRQHPARILHAG